MEITRSNNKTAYEEYEQLLLERDSLYKEKESIYVMYIHEFGDLLVERFHSQINIICTKKSIAFCQAKINRGWIVCLSELNSFIDIEMQGYNDKLSCMIDQNESCRRLTRLSKDENQRIKRIYRKLARLLHPDLNPDIENETWLSDLWERISTAYKFGDLEELENLELLANTALDSLNVEHPEIIIPNIGQRIEKIKNDIRQIVSTEPYIYKKTLENPVEIKKLKEKLQIEIKENELYLEHLKTILTGLILNGVTP